MTLPEATFASGPLTVRVASDVAGFWTEFDTLYPPERRVEADFVDFHVEVRAAAGPRRWIRPLVSFHHDGPTELPVVPRDQAIAIFEWGLNYVISNHMHCWLMIHSAIVARPDGRALLMPGAPGSGKSTLCAGLVQRGWRLLSDEIALVSLADGLVSPLVRPISLKNRSIELIRARTPDAVFSSRITDTHKGDLAFLRPPGRDVAAMAERARVAWIVLPKFEAGAALALTPKSRALAFHDAAFQSFNYPLLGAAGFEAMSRLVGDARCFDLGFGELDAALDALGALP